MARVHPAVEHLRALHEPLTTGELQVLDSLQQLDDRWRIYVQPRIGLDLADFVVAHPDHGVIVVEVRDWRPGSFRIGVTGQVEMRVRGGWSAVHDAPRFVAQRMATYLLNHCFADPSDAHREPAVRAIVVLLRQGDDEAASLLTQTRISVAEDRVRCVSGHALRAAPAAVLGNPQRTRRMTVSDRNLERLHQHLGELTTPQVPAAAREGTLPAFVRRPGRSRSDSPDRERDRLGHESSDERSDEDASASANEERPPAPVLHRLRGAAGSGKSYALAEHAAMAALAGQEVLLLSQSAALATNLRRTVNERCTEVGADPHRVSTSHLVELCMRSLDDARLADRRVGRTVRHRGTSVADHLVARAGTAYGMGFGPRYDVVLVDDGHQLDPAAWDLLLRHVVHPGGEMALAFDPTFTESGRVAWPDRPGDAPLFPDPWIDLHVQHRLPGDLSIVANIFGARYLETAPPVSARSGDRSGTTIRRWRNLNAGGALGRSIGDEVVRLLIEHPDLDGSDVVFLAPTARSGLEAAQTITAAGFPVQHVFATAQRDARRRRSRFHPEAPGIKGTTAEEFRGMEARAIVIGVPPSSEAFRLTLLGMTRVLADPDGGPSMLTVVNQHAALRGFAFTFLSIGGRPTAGESGPADATRLLRATGSDGGRSPG